MKFSLKSLCRRLFVEKLSLKERFTLYAFLLCSFCMFVTLLAGTILGADALAYGLIVVMFMGGFLAFQFTLYKSFKKDPNWPELLIDAPSSECDK